MTWKNKMKSPWRVLRIVRIQASTSVFLLTANSPITHVRPSRGRSITDALIVVLREDGVERRGGCNEVGKEGEG
jgi:hypothetical protein